MRAAAVAGLSEILRGTYCEHFFFEDPAGYTIEIQRFHDPEVARLFKWPTCRCCATAAA